MSTNFSSNIAANSKSVVAPRRKNWWKENP
jgi:hypothetical protein